MAYFDFPVRNRKTSGRAEYVHNMGRGQSGRGIPVGFQDAFMPVPHRRGNHYGYNNPYHQSSATAPDPYLSDLLTSSELDAAYNRPSGYPEGTSGDHYSSDRFSPIRTPFSKAARTLHDSLDHAVKYTEQLEPNFLYETALISPYMDDATRARLWSLKLDFLPVSSAAKDNATTATMEPVPEPVAPSISFSTHEARVLAAVDIWRNVQQPTARDWEELRERGSILSVEDVRLAWRKVRISCSAIEELFEGAKGEQRRCAALLRELASARDALVGIGELWNDGSRERVGLRVGQGQAPEWR